MHENFKQKKEHECKSSDILYIQYIHIKLITRDKNIKKKIFYVNTRHLAHCINNISSNMQYLEVLQQITITLCYWTIWITTLLKQYIPNKLDVAIKFFQYIKIKKTEREKDENNSQNSCISVSWMLMINYFIWRWKNT